MSGATLLFAHGGGFCKQIWDPIIRRLKISPIVHQLATEFVTFDFPYHGTKRDESVAPKLHESNPTSLRVYHPAQDVLPSTTAEVQRQVQLLRENYDAKGERPALIGIGHSMGAGALWNAEVQDPGTFDGLILFEPVYGEDDPVVTDKVTSFLVGVTLQRKALWSSRQEAVQYFETLKNFKSWDRESLAAYLQGALIEDEAAGKPCWRVTLTLKLRCIVTSIFASWITSSSDRSAAFASIEESARTCSSRPILSTR
ncbi:hypothetical protein PC116_g9976 [Phytophthora cactorum]|uniref:AB hydrolase-1 domain-containing protein n=1 Tax=Phytophthora cactorum TaxID=29920 RepID=A0A329T5Z6_9STRA|nr:hypothetical protein PC111_g6194 [Phytophthora cactorum]KAG2932821.1 hypothetical protein PC114_g1677 [Phytophthora cactorum]KAG2941272.1 hypothetical protein PC115_g2043 [Phytophthora cactorum]KAG2954177.1 hypothetical protein PC117_g1437 [Phytophthora cactorum]KAG3000158.1 hypothetical protein PC118_g393 [Phytophthora cactorum]